MRTEGHVYVCPLIELTRCAKEHPSHSQEVFMPYDDFPWTVILFGMAATVLFNHFV